MIAKQIKIIISKVYGTLNNGGHFDIYGSLCSIQTEEDDTSIDIFQISKDMKPLFSKSQKEFHKVLPEMRSKNIGRKFRSDNRRYGIR